MYYGKLTSELKELYEEYYDKFGIYPDDHEELEYGDITYKLYVRDIKEALNKGKPLTDIVQFKHIKGDWDD